ncbi:MAG: amidohydrolase family protein [Ferruginibacter sp.]|nr:amidohydrolase family protein [Ferruginibacter sp.]
MRVFIVSIVFLFSIAVKAQQTPIAFRGALIYTISGKPIENGILIVQKGKIISVTSNINDIPKNAEIRDVTGKIIMPGLVDTHSHLAGPEGGDNSGPLNPEARAMDAINPTSDGFKKALAGGITTINIMPGSGHLMSGQTIYVKMREAKIVEDLLLTNEKGLHGGMKMANGTNSMKGTSGFPGTRAKSASLDRDLFMQAVEYKNKIEKAGKDSSKLPERDLRMEPLLEVLNGKRVVHFHSHKANDILTAIRLSKEFEFRMVLHHISEGGMVADEIAKAGVPCSIINIEVPGGKLEAQNLTLATGGILEKAGALVCFHTDDGITDSRLFLRSAALSVREGMSREKALEGVTIAGAKMLDLSSRVGSLEKGKDADFIILSGDPFSVYTKVEQTWVEGIKRFDLSNPADKAFLLGGYNVYSNDRAEYHHHKNDDHQ